MLDFSKVKTYPIATRQNKEKLSNFLKVNSNYQILKNENLKILAKNIAKAYKNQKQTIVMMGGHVVKVGCTPFII